MKPKFDRLKSGWMRHSNEPWKMPNRVRHSSTWPLLEHFESVKSVPLIAWQRQRMTNGCHGQKYTEIHGDECVARFPSSICETLVAQLLSPQKLFRCLCLQCNVTEEINWFMLPAAEESGMFIHRNERCTEKNV